MYSIETNRLVGFSDLIIENGIITSKGETNNSPDLLNLMLTTGRKNGFLFYDKNNTETLICHIGITRQRKRTEVSYGTEPEYRGKRYMQEALTVF